MVIDLINVENMNKKEITAIVDKLSVLNDQKLKSISRVGTMVSLGFGNLVKNKVAQKTEEGKFITKEVFVPQYALHIDCSFRINYGNSIMMSQRDMFCPNSEMIKSANFNDDEFEVGNADCTHLVVSGDGLYEE